MTLTVGSLFSGIGGLDLGLERAGMEVIWQSEIDPYACRVLNKHWPKVVNHGNIKEIDWTRVQRPDVICGGYPCQPFSTAGQRKGENDPRHLWPWVRQAISELRPRYAILENVRGHLSMGGMSVIGDLTNIGYDCQWRVISASSVGANHKRERVFIVAYPNDTGSHTTPIYSTERGEPTFVGLGGRREDMAYPDSERQQGSSRFQERETQPSRLDLFSPSTKWDKEWTEWKWWRVEPDVGRVAYGVPNRVDRLRGLGNAVVPQVAEIVGRLVMAHANATK
jgi:DNA (cytosine-5)-methyltransferase 1